MNDFNPSGMWTPPADPSALVVGQFYWVTYPYVWQRISCGTKFESEMTSTEKLVCESISGDTGLFKTDKIGHQWVHKTRCVKVNEEQSTKKGFWESLFS
jgi:hypothetical protein